MKLRLILRAGIEDCGGNFCGWSFSTYIVEVPDSLVENKLGTLEVIGGEWIKDE